MKRLDHILRLDEFYKYAVAIFIFVLGFFYVWSFIGLIIYLIWIRKQIHFIFLVFIMIVISLNYAFLTDYNQKSIKQNVTVVSIDSYNDYARYTVKYSRYKFHFYSGLNAYQLGDNLYIKGDITPYRNQTVDKGFNAKHYFLTFHVYGKIDNKEIEFIKHAFHMNAFRDQLKSNVRDLESNTYLSAFIFGEKIKDDQTLDTYSNFNILYLFTISGLHIYVLMSLVKKLLFMLNVSDKFHHIMMILIYAFISYLNLFSFAVLRLLITYIIRLINRKYTINMQNLDMICLAFLIMIVIDIGLIYHQGFIITFTIIIFLELIHPILMPYHPYTKKLLMSMFISIIILPFFTDIYIFQILMLPLIILIIIFILYPFAILTFIFPVTDDLYYFMIINFESFILTLSKYQLYFFVPKFNIYETIVYYFLIIYICFSKSIKQLGKRSVILILAMSFLIYTTKLINDDQIIFLDVGQGDTTIINTSTCKIAVDAYNGTTSYLKNHGIYELDYLILTHSHNDHIKEAGNVLQALKVKQLILSAYDMRYPSYDQRILRLKANDIITCGDIKLNILGPLKHYDNENDVSLVFQLHYDQKTFLFTGDIEEQVEQDLVDVYQKRLKSDVLKVPHHGSITSSTKQFLDYVNPSYAVISLALDNKFGFPNQSVLSRYQKISCVIYRTDLNGTISYYGQRRKEKWRTYL